MPSYQEFKDAEYTRLRIDLLRTKGGPLQQEFLETVLDGQGFAAYLRQKVHADGSELVPLAPTPMTESEFKEPPEDTEATLYKAWSELTPRIACRTTFWANLTCRHIEEQKIESTYLAANGGNLSGGAGRIEQALRADDTEKRNKQMDDCVRTVLRRLGGIPEVRGNRTVYVDCPFARAWWRGQIVRQVAPDDAALAAQVHKTLRISQTYWEKTIDRIVSRNSTFGASNVRNAFLRSLAQLLSDGSETGLAETSGLLNACRIAAMHQGTRELSILDDAELAEIMASILGSA